MAAVTEGTVLWEPSAERRAASRMADYMRWLAEHEGLTFDSYQALWRWSATDIEAFWASLWSHFAIRASAPYARVLDARTMPGARWFEGARLNYAEHALRHASAEHPVLIAVSEGRARREIGWAELQDDVASVAAALRAMGVAAGDRVVSEHSGDIPRTLSGKKLELPVRKVLLGHPVEKVVNADAMANPESLEFFIELARKLNAS